MSWSFTAMARSKPVLKEHVRKNLMAYHKEGSAGHASMTKLADHFDGLIDMCKLVPGQVLKIESSGHLDDGGGNMKIDLTSYGGTVLD